MSQTNLRYDNSQINVWGKKAGLAEIVEVVVVIASQSGIDEDFATQQQLLNLRLTGSSRMENYLDNRVVVEVDHGRCFGCLGKTGSCKMKKNDCEHI